jgi:hypothetical protein
MSKLATTIALAAIAVAVAVVPAAARSVEDAYYNGHVVQFQLPSSDSANSNQTIIGCYHAGPNITGTSRIAPAKLYALFVPGVTQHSCPDGSLAHDHVLSTVPGSPDYTGAWTLIQVVPGPNFSVADMPYTSEAAVLAGAAAGKLVLIPTGIDLLAPVVGG